MEVLIIGLGSIAAKHIAALRAVDPGVTISALRSGEGGDVDGVTNVYDLKTLSARPGFIIISNPTQLHAETILSVLDLNVPLFIEKPPLHTLDLADGIKQKIAQQHLLTYTACNLRFHPCIEFLKKNLGGKRINEVNVYCGSYLPEWRPGKDYKNIYSANKEMGGGVHLDLFHEMDYTCWLFGHPVASKGFISNRSSLNIDAADYANYLLEYPGFNASVILNYYRRKPQRTIEILLDSETWTIDLIKNTVVTDSGELLFGAPDFKIMDTYINQMRYFIDCRAANSAPMNSFAEAVKTLNITLKYE
ncbi:MAG TPA: Gfo/Idh/MocA family oxidoreductase [Mucilaginibacter sp.]